MSAALVSMVTRRPYAAPLISGAVIATGCGVLAVIDPAGGPPLCPFKAMTGLDCPGCGMTRAAHQLLSGHLTAALDLNVLVVVVLPLLAWWGFASLTRAFGGSRLPTVTLSRAWLVTAVVVVAVFGVLRNIPGQPFTWLGTA